MSSYIICSIKWSILIVIFTFSLVFHVYIHSVSCFIDKVDQLKYHVILVFVTTIKVVVSITLKKIVESLMSHTEFIMQKYDYLFVGVIVAGM